MYTIYKMVRREPRLVTFTQVSDQLFFFVNKVAEDGQPLTTRLVASITLEGGETREDVLVSLWASVGEKTPIDRIVELIKQQREAKVLLEDLLKSPEIGEELKEKIKQFLVKIK